ncbi:hypothetical protein MUO14_23465 [Halobacillus shinanisalinarum]|uniref:WXG100 family type VII secretion target n=1 Tax=Halobacillus shinanisalinarum TaxID=2932258 RepID=A0ABY4GYQ4_9BACI|nr:hypothetical protein [Halobacillus shinanisalinarum]UOQ93298.1 hypothetical protein MUO14_23465 [Halobacillus shinanisalinarum]
MSELAKQIDGKPMIEGKEIIRNWTIKDREEAQEVIAFFIDLKGDRQLSDIISEYKRLVHTFREVANIQAEKGNQGEANKLQRSIDNWTAELDKLQTALLMTDNSVGAIY